VHFCQHAFSVKCDFTLDCACLWTIRNAKFANGANTENSEGSLLTLRDRGARFVAVDMPEADDLTVGIMAPVAQAEREAISKRTKEALAVAKARGAKLGNPNGASSLWLAGKGGVALRVAVSANAAAFAKDLAPVLADIQAGRFTSLRAIASELADQGIRTRHGGQWQVSNVKRLLNRLRAALA
jgi:DNA invertase Pin-like site-specific DNA recombinase